MTFVRTLELKAVKLTAWSGKALMGGFATAASAVLVDGMTHGELPTGFDPAVPEDHTLSAGLNATASALGPAELTVMTSPGGRSSSHKLADLYGPLTMGVRVSPLWTQFVEGEAGVVIHQTIDDWPLRIAATGLYGYSTSFVGNIGPYVGMRVTADALPVGDVGIAGAYGTMVITNPADDFYAGFTYGFGLEITELFDTQATPLTVGVGAHHISSLRTIEPYWAGQLFVSANWDFPINGK